MPNRRDVITLLAATPLAFILPKPPQTFPEEPAKLGLWDLDTQRAYPVPTPNELNLKNIREIFQIHLDSLDGSFGMAVFDAQHGAQFESIDVGDDVKYFVHIFRGKSFEMRAYTTSGAVWVRFPESDDTSWSRLS